MSSTPLQQLAPGRRLQQCGRPLAAPTSWPCSSTSRRVAVVRGDRRTGTPAALHRGRPLLLPGVRAAAAQAPPGLNGFNLSREDLRLAQQVMSSLTNLDKYPQLLRWLEHQFKLQEQGGKGDTGALVYALTLKAAELEEAFWDSLDDLSEQEVLAAQAVREDTAAMLLAAVKQLLPLLPLDTVSSCADAAASMEADVWYDEDFFDTVAARVEQRGRAAREEAAVSGPPPPGAPAYLDCRPEALPENLRLLVGAFGKAGHYCKGAMQVLADEIAASCSQLDAGLAAYLVANFMDLQHYHEGMLQAVGVHMLRPSTEPATFGPGGRAPPNIATLTPGAAAELATAFAFFNVRNTPFYQVLMARLSAAVLEETSYEAVFRLYLARGLAPQGVAIPAALNELLTRAAARDLPQTVQVLDAHKHAVLLDPDEEEAVQRLVKYSAEEALCVRQICTVLRTCELLPAGQQEELYAPVASDMPWLAMTMRIPSYGVGEQTGPPRQVLMMLMTDDCYCRNTYRLRGGLQARIRLLQRQGWPVWVLRVSEWQEQVVDASGAENLPEDYTDISLLWAQSLGPTGVADAHVRTSLQAMVNELCAYVDTCVSGAISMLQQQRQQQEQPRQ